MLFPTIPLKLELLIFTGCDAYGWLVRVESYFQVNQGDDYEKNGNGSFGS